MEFEPLDKLDSVLDSIERLKKRSDLLGIILGQYYDCETDTFKEIPKEWKDKRILPSKRPAETPRKYLRKLIEQHLRSVELDELGIY